MLPYRRDIHRRLTNRIERRTFLTRVSPPALCRCPSFVLRHPRAVRSCLMNPVEQLSPNEALAALEKFVVENDDLLTLESLIGRFNIFDALHIAGAEIRHSNFLAFILDPAESHGQSQLFLKALLMDLLKSSPPESRPFSPIELDGTD